VDDSAIGGLQQQLVRGEITRRQATRRLLNLGLTLPMAHVLLAGVAGSAAHAQGSAAPRYLPTRRGGGGALRMLFWQAPTTLNPHFATGAKDGEASRVFYEGLATWDNDGELVPVLAAEIPSRENSGLSADGRSVVWKLKRDVKWQDGTPFTADDLVFNAEYAADKATGAFTAGAFNDLRIEKIDAHTARVVFARPQPFWPGQYAATMLIPRHLFDAYRGARARDAPTNLKPVGTGPYVLTDFKPGDTLRATINRNYHQPNRPHFDAVDLKGGGDSTSAARAVLQTGDYDYAWGLQTEDELLKRMETAGKGRLHFASGGYVEHILFMMADPWNEFQGERGHPQSRHPILSDLAVRRAIALATDRAGIQQFIYGRAATATPNYLHNPPRFRSSGLTMEYSLEKANALLEAAGWLRGTDGVRAKDGKRMKFVLQTSQNSARQKVQSLMKSACAQIGIELELKSVTPSVFFSSDVGNPDTFGKSWADLQMFTVSQGFPDPFRLMETLVSWEVSQKSNNWLGLNRGRWTHPEYDRLYRLTDTELDPIRRAALFIRLNDLACTEHAVIPLFQRAQVAALAKGLQAPLSGWAYDLGSIAHWYREA
jgi:peptide/nickel transport system substrate-binding protein